MDGVVCDPELNTAKFASHPSNPLDFHKSAKKSSDMDKNNKEDAGSSMENKASSVAKELKNLCLTVFTPAEYEAAFLKNGILRGITYQVKILTWTTWKLMTKKDANKWWIGSEVFKAWGFHDLVLKYYNVDENGKISDQKCMYRFIQIKHKSCLTATSKITIRHLLSKETLHRQYSLLYLFKSYTNIIGKFEKLTSDQIVDLMVFTNKDISSLSFLVPMDNDEIFSFQGKGKRYRFDVDLIRSDVKYKVIIDHLRQISPIENYIWDFLSKLVFVVDQPSEPELEKLIVEDMGKVFCTPQLFYNDLYKNIFEWFLIIQNNIAPYLTKEYVMEHLKKMEDMLQAEKKTNIYFTADSLSLANLSLT